MINLKQYILLNTHGPSNINLQLFILIFSKNCNNITSILNVLYRGEDNIADYVY